MNSRQLWKSINNKDIRTNREDNKVQVLKESFKGNINYYKVYKDFNENDVYDAWIYDRNSERKQSEEKFIQLYPYQTLRQGEYIHWNNDIWLITGIDTQYDYLHQGSMTKCIDDRMIFVDESGFHSIPMVSQSKVLRDPLLDNGKVYMIDDTMEATMQKNNDSLSIKENQRFLFGRYTIFKVIEIIDYYIDNTIKIVLKKDERIDKDDVVNKIAYNKDYLLEIVPNHGSEIKGNIGDIFVVEGKYFYDGKEINFTPKWSVDNEEIASIDGDGIITFVGYGVTNITLEYNGLFVKKEISCENISQEFTYSILPTNTKIEISEEPYIFTIDKLLSGSSEILNSSITCDTIPNTFDFNVIDNNTFSIRNINETNKNILITIEDLDTLEIVEIIYRLRAW